MGSSSPPRVPNPAAEDHPEVELPMATQFHKTEAESALQRIANLKDVVGILIVDNDGNILRSTFLEEETTVKYATEITSLAVMTRSAIRELDPQNDVQMIRIKSLRHELIAIIDMQFTLLVAQQYPGFIPVEVEKSPEEVKPEEDEEF